MKKICISLILTLTLSTPAYSLSVRPEHAHHLNLGDYVKNPATFVDYVQNKNVKVALIDWDDTLAHLVYGWHFFEIAMVASILNGKQIDKDLWPEIRKRLLENHEKPLEGLLDFINLSKRNGKEQTAIEEAENIVLEMTGIPAIDKFREAIKRLNEREGEKAFETKYHSVENPFGAAQARLDFDEPERHFLDVLWENLGILAETRIEEFKKSNSEKHMVPGAISFLRFLHANDVKIYIVTGTPTKEIESMLQHLEIEELVREIYGYTKEEDSRDKTMNFKEWAQKEIVKKEGLEEKPYQALTVGDGGELDVGVKEGYITLAIKTNKNTKRLKDLGGKLNLAIDDFLPIMEALNPEPYFATTVYFYDQSHDFFDLESLLERYPEKREFVETYLRPLTQKLQIAVKQIPEYDFLRHNPFIRTPDFLIKSEKERQRFPIIFSNELRRLKIILSNLETETQNLPIKGFFGESKEDVIRIYLDRLVALAVHDYGHVVDENGGIVQEQFDQVEIEKQRDFKATLSEVESVLIQRGEKDLRAEAYRWALFSYNGSDPLARGRFDARYHQKEIVVPDRSGLIALAIDMWIWERDNRFEWIRLLREKVIDRLDDPERKFFDSAFNHFQTYHESLRYDPDWIDSFLKKQAALLGGTSFLSAA